MRNALTALMLMLCASASNADSRSELIAEIVASGTHEFENRRHTVEVSGCLITTYVYEDWGEHPKVLYSSFLVDIRDLQFSDPMKDGYRFHWVENFDGDGLGLALTTIRVKEPATARHEMAMRRDPDKPFRKSPRKGVDTYVYKDKTDFVVIHQGLASPQKPANFIASLERYRIEYCTPIG